MISKKTPNHAKRCKIDVVDNTHLALPKASDTNKEINMNDQIDINDIMDVNLDMDMIMDITKDVDLDLDLEDIKEIVNVDTDNMDRKEIVNEKDIESADGTESVDSNTSTRTTKPMLPLVKKVEDDSLTSAQQHA